MSAWGEFGFHPPRTDSEKQGKFGSDAPAEREAQYLRMRERANGADELKSP